MKRQREARRADLARQREALASGDERFLPVRDKGPVRRFVRDYVDSRFCVAEWFLPLAVIILVLSVIQVPNMQAIVMMLWLGVIVLIIIDSIGLGLRLKKQLRERFPDTPKRGAVAYGLMRTLQMRRLRLPRAAGQARRAALSTDTSGFTGASSAWLAGLGGVRNTVRQELVARQLDEQIAGRFPVGQRLRVLDVGMGQGTQALRLARAGHSVTGLESDASMLAAARESLATEPEGIRERVRLIEGDGRETGVHFLPGSFDVVLCHGVLMYVEEPDPMLAGLARMLGPPAGCSPSSCGTRTRSRCVLGSPVTSAGRWPPSTPPRTPTAWA